MVVLLVCRMNCLLTVARCTVGGVDAPRNVATCQQQALRKKITSKCSGIAVMYFLLANLDVSIALIPSTKSLRNVFNVFRISTENKFCIKHKFMKLAHVVQQDNLRANIKF